MSVLIYSNCIKSKIKPYFVEHTSTCILSGHLCICDVSIQCNCHLCFPTLPQNQKRTFVGTTNKVAQNLLKCRRVYSVLAYLNSKDTSKNSRTTKFDLLMEEGGVGWA